jgi:hypothetical protein
VVGGGGGGGGLSDLLLVVVVVVVVVLFLDTCANPRMQAPGKAKTPCCRCPPCGACSASAAAWGSSRSSLRRVEDTSVGVCSGKRVSWKPPASLCRVQCRPLACLGAPNRAMREAVLLERSRRGWPSETRKNGKHGSLRASHLRASHLRVSHDTDLPFFHCIHRTRRPGERRHASWCTTTAFHANAPSLSVLKRSARWGHACGRARPFQKVISGRRAPNRGAGEAQDTGCTKEEGRKRREEEKKGGRRMLLPALGS